jgi:PHD/YefM family antitoxin component YafN of YafNO toxin-antitoxin module
MVRMSASRIRDLLSETIDQVAFKGQRIILQRHGHDEAALISVEDLKLLEALEDKYDVELARLALAENGKRAPYQQLRKSLGLS